MGSLGNSSYKRNMRSMTAGYSNHVSTSQNAREFQKETAASTIRSDDSMFNNSPFVYEGSQLMFLDDNEKKHKIPHNQKQSKFHDMRENKLPHIDSVTHVRNQKSSHQEKSVTVNLRNELCETYQGNVKRTAVSFVSQPDRIEQVAVTLPTRRESHLVVVSPGRQSRPVRRISSQLLRAHTLPPQHEHTLQEDIGEAISQRLAPPLLRFRSAVRTVLVILRASRNSGTEGKRSSEKLLSFAHYQDEILNSRRAHYGGGLSFDPLQYRALREISVSNEAKAILSMSPPTRTEEQLHVALLSLQTTVDAFCEFPIKMQYSLVKRGWYEQFENKRVIIRQGHTADNFYMILSGKAVVTRVENASGDAKVSTVAVLDKGNTFGELAIMRGARRSATVTCRGDVELLAVSREDFIDIFMHVEKEEEPEHIAFLRNIDVFYKWPIERVPWNDPTICIFTYFRRGTVMCKDIASTEWVYVIKTGSCRVLTTVRSTKPNLPYAVRTSSSTSPKLMQNRRKSDNSSLESIFSSVLSDKCEDISLTKHNLKLPQVKRLRTFTEEELVSMHKRKLDEIAREVTAIRLKQGKPMNTPQQKSAPELFVQLAQLGPKTTFGIEPFAFATIDKGKCISLVSDGAEAILINRKFFVRNTTEQHWRKLRMTLQPYPSDDSLQEKLQDQSNWEAFKRHTFSNYSPSQNRPHRYTPSAR